MAVPGEVAAGVPSLRGRHVALLGGRVTRAAGLVLPVLSIVAALGLWELVSRTGVALGALMPGQRPGAAPGCVR